MKLWRKPENHPSISTKSLHGSSNSRIVQGAAAREASGGQYHATTRVSITGKDDGSGNHNIGDATATEHMWRQAKQRERARATDAAEWGITQGNAQKT